MANRFATVFARSDGKSVGFIANNPMFKGGALDADACQKITSFMVLCDSFNVPLVYLVDVPGFLIGVEGEMRGMPGKVINWMNAMSQVTVPKITVIMRKSYGQAYINMAGGKGRRRGRVVAHRRFGLHGSGSQRQRAAWPQAGRRPRAVQGTHRGSPARHLRVGAG
jgi:acetyl-CoA carboxylase carboxyltransferase component